MNWPRHEAGCRLPAALGASRSSAGKQAAAPVAPDKLRVGQVWGGRVAARLRHSKAPGGHTLVVVLHLIPRDKSALLGAELAGASELNSVTIRARCCCRARPPL